MVQRGLQDRPVQTRTFYNTGNSTMRNQSNIQLTNPTSSSSTQTTDNYSLGNNIGAYFQNKNTQTPNTEGLQKQYPVSNGAGHVNAKSAGGAAAVQGASEAISGIGTGIQSSWNIGNNSMITNNWFNNISGVNGIYNGQHDRASIQAAAEQRGVDRSNNWTNTGKAVAGPLGMLVGGLIGSFNRDNYINDEVKNANYKTMATTDQEYIDPKEAELSTAKSSKEDTNQTAVRARNITYGQNTAQSTRSDGDTDSVSSFGSGHYSVQSSLSSNSMRSTNSDMERLTPEDDTTSVTSDSTNTSTNSNMIQL